jgi:signal transduction histidine kinase
VAASGAVLGFYVAGNEPGPILWLLVFVVFSAAVALPLSRFLPWTVPVIPAVLAGSVDRPFLGLLEAEHGLRIVGTLVGLAVAAALGALIRAGRQSARREREAELRRHAYAERLRIAREVHDVVGHSLSVITMQAGVALHVLDKRPDQAAPALQVIRTTSKEALDELRGTLAVFRGQGGEDPQPVTPPPGLARLEDLVASVEDGTRTVRLHRDAALGQLPGAVDHAAYRIVQEALTNAVRHAPQADVEVRLGCGPRSMLIEVSDNGPARVEHPPAEGGGLAGMRERAAAVGGTVRAEPRPEGGFAVHAELPLPDGLLPPGGPAKPEGPSASDEPAQGE